MKTRDEAFALLTEHTKSESLIKHAIAVEAAMRSTLVKMKSFGVSRDYFMILIASNTRI